MVNQKKMSKSSVAVIVLAILLALSMVLGLTGAWFHSKVETDNVDSPNFGFGLVKIAGSGQAEITYEIAEERDVSKMVDHDKIIVADTLAIKNNSTVEILYVVDKAVTVTVNSASENPDEIFTAEDLKTWLGLEAADQSKKGRVDALGNIALQSAEGSYELKSEGKANGKVGTFKITVSANVYAVQAGNIDTVEELKAAFTAAGYAGANTLTLEMFANN